MKCPTRFIADPRENSVKYYLSQPVRPITYVLFRANIVKGNFPAQFSVLY